MPIPIDTRKPFRYPSELKRLVEAIINAGDHDEARWIEWKRSLDLTASTSIQHIVKQILGFANRDPALAASWTGGHAYLVIGASPKDLRGVAHLDPADLISKVNPYVGSSITWTPEYIEVDGKTVLVIIIAPPRQGDKIHALRKPLGPYKAGTIFTRRSGQTDQADADELELLQRRLLARTTYIDVAIELTSSTIEARPAFKQLIDGWVEQERATLLSARHEPEPDDDDELPEFFRDLKTEIQPDRRTEEEYAAEIDRFLEKSRDLLMQRTIWRLVRHMPAKLNLQVVNRDDRNLAKVHVCLEIPASSAIGISENTRAVVSKDYEPRLRERPRPLGRPPEQWWMGWNKPPNPKDLPARASRPTKFRGEGWSARVSSSKTEIEFETHDIRPRQVINLPPVPIIVKVKPGRTLNVDWGATATNADGRSAGILEIGVSESTLDVMG